MRIHGLVLIISVVLLLSACGGGSDSGGSEVDRPNSEDVIYSYQHKGFSLYSKNLPYTNYKLDTITDSVFNNLTASNQLLVADKLLATLYFGLETNKLQALIDSGTFISSIKQNLTEKKNDLDKVETRLNDSGKNDEEFYFYNWPEGTEETAKILARFYVLEHLDKHYLDYWMSYVLTSNIMFSPAYELASSHSPNIDRVYNRLVRDLRKQSTVQYSTYLHMVSDDNWRRFRSPEDNGREMMEIYLFDFDDKKVPIAGKALQNWHLDRDNDTLVVGLDENYEPLTLFNTTIYNGDDFYSELVKSDNFIKGLVKRLVNVYFSTFTQSKKQAVVDKIVASKPKTWQDILLQIVFSNEYLLSSDKPKSMEEVFFSLSQKIHFKHYRGFFPYLARSLTEMNQASMKYKVGKPNEVPLDTQSFSSYHKFVRESILISSKGETSDGWDKELLISNELFVDIPAYQHEKMVEKLVNYLFKSAIARLPNEAEMLLFKQHFLDDEGNYVSYFRLFKDNGSLNERRNAAVTIFEYISRLTEVYRFKKVAS